MIVMLAVTFSALALIMRQKIGLLAAGTMKFSSDGMQLIFAVLLLALGVLVAISGVSKLGSKEKA
jgi:carbon starvation protein